MHKGGMHMPAVQAAVSQGLNYRLYLQMNDFVRLVIAALIFLIALEKKPRFMLKLALSLLLCTAARFAFALIRWQVDTVLDWGGSHGFFVNGTLATAFSLRYNTPAEYPPSAAAASPPVITLITK